MNPTKTSATHRVLLVDDDDAVREVMTLTLTAKGFDVVPAAGVVEALRLITTESFDVLITDLHMPNPSDGFTVVTAMRHSQPEALTLLVSGYPDVKSAMEGILLEADHIIVKPVGAANLAELVHEKLQTRRPSAQTPKERVASILERCQSDIIENWLVRVKEDKRLNHISLTDEERTAYLPKLIEDLIVRLRVAVIPGNESSAVVSPAAIAHGTIRKQQGYTAAMLVHDSRILQVTLFGMLQSNMSALDFSLLLPDVMTIADEVDSQLTQVMESYMAVEEKLAAA